MQNKIVALALIGLGWALGAQALAQSTPPRSSIEYIQPEGQAMGPPFSPAVKVGKLVFVSGIPALDANGKIAVGDFPAQMKQVMENISGILKSAGTGWDHVVKTNILLVRRDDFKEMNQIYASYFPSKKYPARTTAVVASLPNPDFLLEIECIAALD